MHEQLGGIARTTVFRRVLVYADDLPVARAYLWRARGIPADLAAELAEAPSAVVVREA